MKGEKKVRIGTILLLAAIAQFIVVSLLISDRPELRFLSPISSGIVGACLAKGIGMIQRGRDPKTDKHKWVEEHDERNQLIQGKGGIHSPLRYGYFDLDFRCLCLLYS